MSTTDRQTRSNIFSHIKNTTCTCPSISFSEILILQCSTWCFLTFHHCCQLQKRSALIFSWITYWQTDQILPVMEAILLVHFSHTLYLQKFHSLIKNENKLVSSKVDTKSNKSQLKLTPRKISLYLPSGISLSQLHFSP